MKHTHNQLPAVLVTVVMAGGLVAVVNTSVQADRSGRQTSNQGAAAKIVAGATGTLQQAVSQAKREAAPQAAKQAELDAALGRIEKRLAQADKEALAAVDRCLSSLRQLFSKARKGTRPFAEDALSLSSKWRLMADYLPGTRGDRHATYMKEAFERHIFSGTELGHQIESAIAEFQRVQQDIENRALVDIGVDLESLKLQTGRPPSQHTLQQRVLRLLEDAAGNVQGDLANEVLVAVSSDVAQQLVRLIATRLGVSSAILGTGASTSWATFGLSMAASLLIDWVVTEIWDWWADPTGELAAKIDRQVYQLRYELLDGPQGLKKTLSAAAAKRNELRQQAVVEAFVDWAN